MDQQTTEVLSPITQTTPKRFRGPSKKVESQIKMVMAGLDPRVYKLKAKVRKYSLQAPDVSKLAHNQIKRILKGIPREEDHRTVTKDGQVIEYTDKVYATDTNMLAAVSMVYDRIEPVIRQNVNLNANIDISPVDLSVYRNDDNCG
jgi:hypothetical protein